MTYRPYLFAYGNRCRIGADPRSVVFKYQTRSRGEHVCQFRE